jgi:hypothetical protein
MKPYGNTRYENLVCAYGCCSGGCVHKGTLGYRVPKAVRRRARKRARQTNRDAVSESALMCGEVL